MPEPRRTAVRPGAHLLAHVVVRRAQQLHKNGHSVVVDDDLRVLRGPRSDVGQGPRSLKLQSNKKGDVRSVCSANEQRLWNSRHVAVPGDAYLQHRRVLALEELHKLGNNASLNNLLDRWVALCERRCRVKSAEGIAPPSPKAPEQPRGSPMERSFLKRCVASYCS